jgi:hypothetical protein
MSGYYSDKKNIYMCSRMKCISYVLVFVFIISAIGINGQTPNSAGGAGSTRAVNSTPANYSGSIPVNYVRTWQANAPITTEADIISTSQPTRNVQQSTQYSDGLGRPLQSVVKGITPSGTDLVSPNIYDEFGREKFHYLPYTSTSADGSFKYNAFAEQQSFNSTQFPNEQFFYGETRFDASPLNRVEQTMPVGNSWVGSGRGTSVDYQVNTSSSEVAIWYPQSGGGSLYIWLLRSGNIIQNSDYR